MPSAALATTRYEPVQASLPRPLRGGHRHVQAQAPRQAISALARGSPCGHPHPSEARPLAQGDSLGPRRQRSPLGRLREATAAALCCLPNVPSSPSLTNQARDQLAEVHPRGRQAQRPRRRRQGQLPPHLLRDARSRRMGVDSGPGLCRTRAPPCPTPAEGSGRSCAHTWGSGNGSGRDAACRRTRCSPRTTARHRHRRRHRRCRRRRRRRRRRRHRRHRHRRRHRPIGGGSS